MRACLLSKPLFFVNADTAQEERERERKRKKFEREGVESRKKTTFFRKQSKRIEKLRFFPLFLPLSFFFCLGVSSASSTMRSLASCSSAAAMPQASTSARTSASAPATPMTTLAARRRSHRCPPSRRWSSSASALNSDPATRPRPSWTLFASSEAAEARAAASSGEEAPPSTSDQSSSISPTSAPAATAAPLAAAANVVRARRPLNQARVATLGASKSASRAVDEGARPLGEDNRKREKEKKKGRKRGNRR